MAVFDQLFGNIPVTLLELRGVIYFMVWEVGAALDYADNGRTLVASVREWQDQGELRADTHLLLLAGEDLALVKELIGPAVISPNTRSLLLLTEQGLYRTLMLAGGPKAMAFRDWLDSDVIPRIRKTGSCLAGPSRPALDDPAPVRALGEIPADPAERARRVGVLRKLAGSLRRTGGLRRAALTEIDIAIAELDLGQPLAFLHDELEFARSNAQMQAFVPAEDPDEPGVAALVLQREAVAGTARRTEAGARQRRAASQGARRAPGLRTRRPRPGARARAPDDVEADPPPGGGNLAGSGGPRAHRRDVRTDEHRAPGLLPGAQPPDEGRGARPDAGGGAHGRQRGDRGRARERVTATTRRDARRRRRFPSMGRSERAAGCSRRRRARRSPLRVGGPVRANRLRLLRRPSDRTGPRASLRHQVHKHRRVAEGAFSVHGGFVVGGAPVRCRVFVAREQENLNGTVAGRQSRGQRHAG